LKKGIRGQNVQEDSSPSCKIFRVDIAPLSTADRPRQNYIGFCDVRSKRFSSF